MHQIKRVLLSKYVFYETTLRSFIKISLLRNEIKFPLWRYCSICLKWGQSKLQILHRERPLLHIYKQQNWFDAVKCIYTLRNKIFMILVLMFCFNYWIISLSMLQSYQQGILAGCLKTLTINRGREGVFLPGRLAVNGIFHVQCLVKSRELCLYWAPPGSVSEAPPAVTRS